MYRKKDYIRRGWLFVNNFFLPRRKKLSTLMLYATDACNSACRHCLIWAKNPVVHLSKEKIIEIMQSRCITKNTLVGLEGGEFLLHPEAMEILAWFKKNHPKFDLLCNSLKPDNVISAVEKYPPQRLYISLDGNKDTYLHMRGKDGYDSVIKVIENCPKNVPISLMFTLSPYNNFGDLEHVVGIAKKYNIDLRVGVYNDIAFFDTVEKAHAQEVGSRRHEEILNYKTVKQRQAEIRSTKGDRSFPAPLFSHFQEMIPASLIDTTENYDFLLLYDEWRKQKLSLKCYSIFDALVIHPNGNVPICQNLETSLGNVYENTLDEIFNSRTSCKLQNKHKNTCNACWINFHRKYDIVMLRTLEKFIPKRIIEWFYGKYSWTENKNTTYNDFIKKHI